jgi:hypothetical protein
VSSSGILVLRHTYYVLSPNIKWSFEPDQLNRSSNFATRNRKHSPREFADRANSATTSEKSPSTVSSHRIPEVPAIQNIAISSHRKVSDHHLILYSLASCLLITSFVSNLYISFAMAELNQLKSKRKQIRSSITRFENFVKNFQSTDNIRTLRLRYENFKPILHTYNEIQDNIDILNADAEASESDNERIDDETRIYNLLAQAEDLIEKSSIIPSTTSTEVNLPTINLPHFNGEYTEWTVFYNSFLSLIHENAKLENIQKLHYLGTFLSRRRTEANRVTFRFGR